MFPIIISIEGNIGSGKSTIMKYLASNFSLFAKENGKNVKIAIFKNQLKFGIVLQIKTMLILLKIIIKIKKNTHSISNDGLYF